MDNTPPPPDWNQAPVATPVSGTPPPPPPPGQWTQGAPPPQVPWTPMPQAAAQPKKRSSGLIRLAIVLAIGAAVVIGFFLLREMLPGNVGSLQIGDCIDLPASDDSISDVQHRRCAEPHDAEVFMLITDPAGSTEGYPIIRPGEHFLELARTHCLPTASTYMGVAFASRTDLDIGIFYPTFTSWRNGDRGVTCYLNRIDEAKMTAPLRAAGATSS